jgi:hypothetical protein
MDLAAGVEVAQRLCQLHGPAPYIGGWGAEGALEVAAAAELQHDGAEVSCRIDTHAQQLDDAGMVAQRQVDGFPVEGAHRLFGRELQRLADVRHVQHLDGHLGAGAQQPPVTHDAERTLAQRSAQVEVLARDEAGVQKRRQRELWPAAHGGPGIGCRGSR